MDRARNKPSEQTMGNRAADEGNKQGTRVEGCGRQGTKRIRRRLELRWNKVLFSCLWRRKFCNQSKLFHQIKKVFSGNTLQEKVGKHMINQFHGENTAFFNFLPVLGNLGNLKGNKAKHNNKTVLIIIIIIIIIMMMMINTYMHINMMHDTYLKRWTVRLSL